MGWSFINEKQPNKRQLDFALHDNHLTALVVDLTVTSGTAAVQTLMQVC